MAKLKQAGIRFDLETYQWLETEAAKAGTPISALVREGVELLKAERKLITQMRLIYLQHTFWYTSLHSKVFYGILGL